MLSNFIKNAMAVEATRERAARKTDFREKALIVRHTEYYERATVSNGAYPAGLQSNMQDTTRGCIRDALRGQELA